MIVLPIMLLTAGRHVSAHETGTFHSHVDDKEQDHDSFRGFGDLLPPTCRQLMDTLKINMTRLHPNLLNAVEDEFTSLAVYCPFSTVILTCLMQNIFEIRRSPNPLVWASGYLIDFQTASDISQKVCLWYQYPEKGTKECLLKTEPSRSYCRKRISNNLEYVRSTMYPDIANKDRFNMVCTVHHELSECIATEVSGQCGNETANHMKLFYEILGRQNCSKVDQTTTKSNATKVNLKEDLVRKALSGCGFDESLYGLPMQKFSFRKYVSSLTKICSRLDNISTCLREKIGESKNSIQRYLGDSIDLTAMGAFTRAICSGEGEFRKDIDCLEGLNTNVEYCINTVKSNNMIDRYYDPKKRKEPMICSVLEDFSNCFAIQASRCSTRLADVLRKSHTDGMHGMCKKGKHTPSHIGGSVLLHCGVTMATKIEGLMAILNPNSSLLKIIDTIVKFACTEVDRYMTCIDRYFDKSTSLLDKFMRNIVDFSKKNKIRSMLKNVCMHMTHIKRQMPCLLQHKKDFQTCASLSLPMLKNSLLTLNNMKGRQLRLKFCTDLAAMLACAIDTVGHCDQGLGNLANKTVLYVLNTKHCDKVIDDTFQSQPHSQGLASQLVSNTVIINLLIFLVRLVVKCS